MIVYKILFSDDYVCNHAVFNLCKMRHAVNVPDEVKA